MTDRETKALMSGLRRREQEEIAGRLDRIQRALKKHGKNLMTFELTNLENALGPAIGRIEMDRR